jgi:hypothetical protein
VIKRKKYDQRKTMDVNTTEEKYLKRKKEVRKNWLVVLLWG